MNEGALTRFRESSPTVSPLRASIVNARRMIVDKQLQALLDAPLANALEINIPLGRRPAQRGKKPVYEGDALGESLTSRQVRERAVDAKSKKIEALLDHYATTEMPFDRIAAHVDLPVEKVRASMTERGRSE